MKKSSEFWTFRRREHLDYEILKLWSIMVKIFLSVLDSQIQSIWVLNAVASLWECTGGCRLHPSDTCQRGGTIKQEVISDHDGVTPPWQRTYWCAGTTSSFTGASTNLELAYPGPYRALWQSRQERTWWGVTAPLVTPLYWHREALIYWSIGLYPPITVKHPWPGAPSRTWWDTMVSLKWVIEESWYMYIQHRLCALQQ